MATYNEPITESATAATTIAWFWAYSVTEAASASTTFLPTGPWRDSITEASQALTSFVPLRVFNFSITEASPAATSLGQGIFNEYINESALARESVTYGATSVYNNSITEASNAQDLIGYGAGSNYSTYFLNAKSSVVQLELLEVSHPNFTQTYRLVRNAINGVTVTLEDANVRTFNYYPLRIESLGARDNLDYGIKIDLGDLGEVLPVELDAVATANGYLTKPTVIYRTYRSDDLTKPLFGPLLLEVTNFSFNKDGASFEAKAPALNLNRTGEVYKLDRFTMLRGFL